MRGIRLKLCPKCKEFMIPYFITTGKTYYKCPSCGYDSANEQYTWTNRTEPYKGGDDE